MMWEDARILTTVRRRIMVISAKGGVGKSTVTVNLAAAIAAQGHKAAIFDADAHGPNIPTLLGVRRKHDLPLHPNLMVTIEARADSPAMRSVSPFERYGIKLTSLGLLVGDQQVIEPQGEIVGKIMTFMMRQVDWGGSDVLLIDMPPGTGEPLQSILETGIIDGVVLVTTREQLAHQDNGRLLSLLRRLMVNVVGVVENMTHIVCPNCGEHIELYPVPVSEMQQIYHDTPILASLPFHPHLIRQRGDGPPLPLADPDSPISQQFMHVADHVMGKRT